MKTVQEWLNEVDEESLADTYFVEFPIDFLMLSDQNHTVAEIRRAAREQLIDYVRKLRTIAVPPHKEGEKTAVFYASKGHRNHERGIVAEMCYVEEVLASDEPEHYACGLTDQAKVMGYLVADTPLTTKNILTVLAQILFETSFFGYNQEGLSDVIESLKQSEEDINADRTYTMEEVREHLGLPPKEPDEEADELASRIIEAECAYDLFCRRREEAKLRGLFRGEQLDK
ncbi:MAG: hypothetical protein E7211_19675 [Clostridium lundense]|nr:hypothetical protein [Clostridium lundense]